MRKSSQLKTTINIEDLIEEYVLDTSIFTEIDDRLLRIYNRWDALNKADKTIIILYAELKSYRDVGELLGVSHTTVARFIKEIRKKLC